jgi:hypothetical protein
MVGVQHARLAVMVCCECTVQAAKITLACGPCCMLDCTSLLIPLQRSRRWQLAPQMLMAAHADRMHPAYIKPSPTATLRLKLCPSSCSSPSKE